MINSSLGKDRTFRRRAEVFRPHNRIKCNFWRTEVRLELRNFCAAWAVQYWSHGTVSISFYVAIYVAVTQLSENSKWINLFIQDRGRMAISTTAFFKSQSWNRVPTPCPQRKCDVRNFFVAIFFAGDYWMTHLVFYPQCCTAFDSRIARKIKLLSSTV